MPTQFTIPRNTIFQTHGYIVGRLYRSYNSGILGNGKTNAGPRLNSLVLNIADTKIRNQSNTCWRDEIRIYMRGRTLHRNVEEMPHLSMRSCIGIAEGEKIIRFIWPRTRFIPLTKTTQRVR